MEAHIKQTSTGAARMAQFEGRLATEVERRVMEENKIAKTESALIAQNPPVLPAQAGQQNKDHQSTPSTQSTTTAVRPLHLPHNPPLQKPATTTSNSNLKRKAEPQSSSKAYCQNPSHLLSTPF